MSTVCRRFSPSLGPGPAPLVAGRVGTGRTRHLRLRLRPSGAARGLALALLLPGSVHSSSSPPMRQTPGRAPTRVTATTCGRPCWLSVVAHGRMAMVSIRHAGSGLKVIEAPYCMLLLCPYGTIMGWPSRAGPQAGPSPLSSASARRRRRGSPRHAARASPLRLSGPVGPARIPGSLSSTSVAAVVFAPLRKRATPPPGFYASTLRFSGPVGPARIPRSLSSISASLYVRAGRSGPPLRPPTFGCDHLSGGRVFLPRSLPPLRWGGTGGGAWSSPGKRRVGSVQMGTEWDVVLCSRCSGCARGATLQSQ